MNYLVSVLCLLLCYAYCSTEKDVKHLDEHDDKPEEYSYYQGRRQFGSIADIPKDYVEELKEYYNIKEPEDYDTDAVDAESPGDARKISHHKEKQHGLDESHLSSNETSENGTCKICEVRDEDKRLRLETIRNTILKKLGFDHTTMPNMTGKAIPRIPSIQKIIEQYGMQGDAPYQPTTDDYIPEDDYYGQVQKAFTISMIPPADLQLDEKDVSYFDLPETVMSRKVREAVLWIYIERPKTMPKKKSVITINMHIIRAGKSKHNVKEPFHYKKTSSYGWVQFRATHIVHHWLRHPETNRGVVIRAMDEDGNNLVVSPERYEDDDLNPMLEMTTVEDLESRKKRSTYPSICTEEDRVESCCRYALRVDFVQFGWDWVIAPTGYMANYCSGECFHRHMDNTPQSYLIQQTPDGRGPCCTPSKMYPLAMLYFDHAHTVLYTYMQKMIVERCGCA